MAVKKTAKIEVVAAKSALDFEKEIAAAQISARTAFNDLSAALVEKREELDALLVLLADKQKELGAADKAEGIVEKIAELEALLETKTADHERAVKALTVTYADKMQELERQLRIEREKREDELAEELRQKRQVESVQDIERRQAFEDRLRDIARKADELYEKENELGEFEAKVEAAVATKVGAIKRQLDIQAKESTMETTIMIAKLKADYESANEARRVAEEIADTAKAEAESMRKQLQDLSLAAVKAQGNQAVIDEVRAIALRQADAKR